MLKWVLRKVTGKCELLRICYGEPKGGHRTCAVEHSLKHSKSESLKKVLTELNVDLDAALQEIIHIKSITVEVHPQFEPILRTCLSQICGYNELFTEIETIRKTPYNSENAEHEKMLIELWEDLMPGVPLESRYTRQWGEIGFQGEDPMTDFRGMGMLGLHNLVFFTKQHSSTARQVLFHSLHPQYGYSFAIVGINITGLAHHLFKTGVLKTHFYNLVQGKPKVEHFHQVYCYLLYEFDKFWHAEKPNIMEFNRVKNKFQKRITMLLKSKTAQLTGKFAVAEH